MVEVTVTTVTSLDATVTGVTTAVATVTTVSRSAKVRFASDIAITSNDTAQFVLRFGVARYGTGCRNDAGDRSRHTADTLHR
jgi:hypothetical protein